MGEQRLITPLCAECIFKSEDVPVSLPTAAVFAPHRPIYAAFGLPDGAGARSAMLFSCIGKVSCSVSLCDMHTEC